MTEVRYDRGADDVAQLLMLLVRVQELPNLILR
jgi:hypothetical protein